MGRMNYCFEMYCSNECRWYRFYATKILKVFIRKINIMKYFSKKTKIPYWKFKLTNFIYNILLNNVHWIFTINIYTINVNLIFYNRFVVGRLFCWVVCLGICYLLGISIVTILLQVTNIINTLLKIDSLSILFELQWENVLIIYDRQQFMKLLNSCDFQLWKKQIKYFTKNYYVFRHSENNRKYFITFFSYLFHSK